MENYGLTVVDIRRMERGTDHAYLDWGLFPSLNYVKEYKT